jgi:hypothetical protein
MLRAYCPGNVQNQPRVSAAQTRRVSLRFTEGRIDRRNRPTLGGRSSSAMMSVRQRHGTFHQAPELPDIPGQS